MLWAAAVAGAVARLVAVEEALEAAAAIVVPCQIWYLGLLLQFSILNYASDNKELTSGRQFNVQDLCPQGCLDDLGPKILKYEKREQQN